MNASAKKTTTRANRTNRTNRTRIALVTGALALSALGVAGGAHALTSPSYETAGMGEEPAPTASTSGPEIHFWTSGKAVAGATLDVYADCGTNKNGGAVTTAEVSGSATSVLSPMADGPHLYGPVTLPADFAGSGVLYLTCDNAATATTILVEGQSESTADGVIPPVEGAASPAYESDGMGEEPAPSGSSPTLKSEGMGEEPAPSGTSAGSTQDPVSTFWDGDGYLVPDDCEGGPCTGPVAGNIPTE